MPISPETAEILKEKGIVGVSDPQGRPIRIYVESEEDLLKLPSTISVQGVSTPVQGIVIGRIYIQKYSGKYRPAPGGVSIGHKDITAGTLGCVVRDKRTGRRVILSNNHVLAHSNLAEVGDEILQPGKYDGGTMDDTIARLTRFVKIKTPSEGYNLVDAAIATPLSDDLIRDDILDIGMISGVGLAKEGMEVQKTGRTTEHTVNVIMDTNATIKVYGYPWGFSIFEEQILTRAMSLGGDSGSALLTKDNKLVGLLFAGSSAATVYNKIQHVFSLLDVEIPSPKPKVRWPILVGLTATPWLFRMFEKEKFGF